MFLALPLLISTLTLKPANDSKGSSPTGITDGNSLMYFCESSSEFQVGICAGYVTGIADAQPLLELKQPFCIPENATNGQELDVVKKYLHDHPETRHHNALVQVISAYQAAFPCPASK